MSLLEVMAFAQDSHFSNYTLAPLTLNPAMTGMMNGTNRLVANFREQWRSVLENHSYKTIAASYDHRFCGYKDYGGIGFKAMADRSGSKNYSIYNVGLTMAYSKDLGKLGNLSVGGEVGLIQHRVNVDAFQFESQFDGFYFDPNLPNLENFASDGYTFMDISAGLTWYNHHKNLFVGFSMHHINKPNYAFKELAYPINSEVDIKFTAHISSIIPFGIIERFGLMPRSVFHVQGNQWQLVPGLDFKTGLGDKNNQTFKHELYLGAAVRLSGHNENFIHSDAIIFTTRFGFDRYTLGISYDYNISGLQKASNRRGAFELSFVFVFGDDNCTYCPSF